MTIGAKTLRNMTIASMIAALLPNQVAHAADPAAGRMKARQCQACHGLDGVSRLAEAPNISGQVEQYLAKSLHDFQSGARKNEMMSVIVLNLKDEDIADLSAYYAAFQITVQKP